MSAFEEAAGYDAWDEPPVGRLTDTLEKEAVFSLITNRPGRALDLSCGTGNNAFALARRGWYVIGVDRSLSMLRHARGKLHLGSGDPAFVAEDAVALPLRNVSVSLATLILGFEFFADPTRALREVRRVLGPGERSSSPPFPEWPPDAVASAQTTARSIVRVAGGAVSHDRELEGAVRAAGFAIVEQRAAVDYLPFVRSAHGFAHLERFATAHVLCAGSPLAVRLDAEPGSLAGVSSTGAFSRTDSLPR